MMQEGKLLEAIRDFLPTPSRLLKLTNPKKWRYIAYKVSLFPEVLLTILKTDCPKVPGHLSLRDGAFLLRCARKVKRGGNIVEIGAYKGRSTCFIASGIKEGVTLWSIDTFKSTTMGKDEGEDTFKEFKKNTEKFGNRIIAIRGLSEEVAKRWDKEIDFLWIDGDHSFEGCSKDIEMWVPFVKSRGIVAFHDYPNAPGVKKAVDEIFRKKFEGKSGGIVDLIYWGTKK